MRSMTDEVLVVAVRGSTSQPLMATIRPSSGCSATTFSRMGEGRLKSSTWDFRLTSRAKIIPRSNSPY
jgi:hypothetical protein